jgi:hypothetical protein
VCAIREWITKASVEVISEVLPTGIACTGIWRYQSELTELLSAIENLETDAAYGCHFGDGQFENICELRRIESETIDKLTNYGMAALDFYRHPGGGIEDEAGELK